MKIENTVIEAILKINPNAEVSVSGDDINTIVWENGTTPIPKDDIEAKMAELSNIEEQEATAKENLKASAKAKLIAGEPLTEEEANTIVL